MEPNSNAFQLADRPARPPSSTRSPSRTRRAPTGTARPVAGQQQREGPGRQRAGTAGARVRHEPPTLARRGWVPAWVNPVCGAVRGSRDGELVSARAALHADVAAVCLHHGGHDRQARARCCRPRGSATSRRGRTARTPPAAGPRGCRGRRRSPSAPPRRSDVDSPVVTVVPGGVCVRALDSRFASTWCSRASSPGTVTGSAGRSSRQWCSGPATCASLTTSTTSRDRSTVAWSSGRPESRRASRSRSSTSVVIRAASDSTRPIACATSGVRVAAAADQLGVAADGGERRAQLVARVRDELADPGLALVPGGERVVRRGRASGSARAPPARPPCAGRCSARAPARRVATSPRSSGSSATRPRSRPPAAAAAVSPHDERAGARRGEQPGERDAAEDQPGGQQRVVHVGHRQPGDDDVPVAPSATAMSRYSPSSPRSRVCGLAVGGQRRAASGTRWPATESPPPTSVRRSGV